MKKPTEDPPGSDKESFFGWGFRKCWTENNPIVKQLGIGIVLGFTLISMGYIILRKIDQK